MLFNSYIFILLFLPITLFVFYRLGFNKKVAVIWLIGASLFFYGWWAPKYLLLIVISILFNYSNGLLLASEKLINYRKKILLLGVSFNLGLLGYYKYANFFVDNINQLFGSSVYLSEVVLPLAISFFTFQQVAFLVDAYRGKTKEFNFLHYCLFVTFFPQLIAGPIVHHKEILPQFSDLSIYKVDYKRLSIGLTIFIIGLGKKVILADSISVYVEPVFSASVGSSLDFLMAWGGALSYTLQLYFDLTPFYRTLNLM